MQQTPSPLADCGSGGLCLSSACLWPGSRGHMAPLKPGWGGGFRVPWRWQKIEVIFIKPILLEIVCSTAPHPQLQLVFSAVIFLLLVSVFINSHLPSSSKNRYTSQQLSKICRCKTWNFKHNSSIYRVTVYPAGCGFGSFCKWSDSSAPSPGFKFGSRQAQNSLRFW